MKIPIKILMITMTLGVSSFVARQMCESIQFIKGASYQMDRYQKGKKVGYNKMLVKDVVTNGNTKTAIVHSEIYNGTDKKGEGDVKFICAGNKLKFDISGMLKSAEMPPNFEMKMEDTYIEIPSNPTAGQSLADANFNMTIIDKNSGSEMGTIKIINTNRKIVGKETIKTPAGSFEVWKITSDSKGDMNMMGMNRPIGNSKMVNYYNKEVGLVKMETLDDKGVVISYEELSSFKKP